MRSPHSVNRIKQKAYQGPEQEGRIELLTGLSLFANASRDLSPRLIVVILAPVFLLMRFIGNKSNPVQEIM